TVRDPAVDEVAASSERVKVHTPGHRTIEEICAFLAVPPARLLKSLVYVAGDVTVMAVVRGDHAVNEVQLARALGVDAVHLAGEAEVQRATGAVVGFAGPVGFTGRIVVDRAAAALRDAACGANESDHHYTGVAFGRDFTGDVVAIRLATAGDPCPRCEGQLQSYRGIEAGHIFVLGTHYSSLMKATYLDSDQTKKPFVMGCYGIGISRLIATALEQHNDANGMRWPMCLSPYHVHLCTLGTEPAITDAARTLYDTLWAAGIEVLWDDRAERPGTKFADADLIGIPLRVTVGARGLAAGTVELKLRSEQDVRNVELVPIAEAATTIADRVRGLA
ncbi:MAG: YbaK/EbsC family protein, partial [Kofleriaceae bacterium]